MKYIFPFLLVVLLGACSCVPGYYRHPRFKTKYTIEEHIQRISERTEEKFSWQIAEGIIADYTVDIIYAFYDDDPEYFLVELEYAEEFQGTCTIYVEDEGKSYYNKNLIYPIRTGRASRKKG